MKRKLLFITLLMLFCSTMFGQHWTMTEADIVKYTFNTTVNAAIKIQGQTPENIEELEIAAFHNGVLRGVASPVVETLTGQYVAYLVVYSSNIGELITFKLYDPSIDKEYDTDYTINFTQTIIGESIDPVIINFYTKHWNYVYNPEENYMALPCIIKVDGNLIDKSNYEIAAFSGNQLRGVANPELELVINIYKAMLKIDGTNGETISFKLFDVDEQKELETDYTISYDFDYFAGDVTIEFKNNPVAMITNATGNHYFSTLEAAVAAAQNGETIILLQNVTLEETLTIEKSVTIDGAGYKIIPADATKTYNSAIMVGNSGWGDDHGEVIILNNIKFNNWKSNYGVVRAQGVTLNMTACEFNGNDVSNAAYGVLSLNFTDATVTNSIFKQNKDRAIDINYNGDDSNAVVTIDGCTFEENASDGAGIVVRNDGTQLVVTNSKFLNNTVTTTGNAATIYAGWGTNDVITGCYFSGNNVTTSYATTIRFASAIFCDGCTVTGNAFGVNTAIRNGETITTTVAVGAHYGAANISGNYWGGNAPVPGVVYTVEFANNNVAVNDYYKEYTNGVLTDKVTLNNVAKAGKYYYESLKDAFASVQDGETITMLANVEISESIKVNNNITLDLNGNTITGTDKETKSFALFEIQPSKELIVNDENNTGKITLTATNNRGWNAYSSVISNQRGKLTINGGTIEHLGGTDMAYAIDNLTNGKGTYAETIINGGTVKSPYRAIRQFLNGVEAQNILTVKGGTIEGTNRSIWMQEANASANPGKLTIGENASVKGNILLEADSDATEWPVEVSIDASTLKDGAQVLTENIPSGYEVKEMNGVYSVYHGVAKIGNNYYDDLSSALKAVTSGCTVEILTDITIASDWDCRNTGAKVTVPVTINGNGKTIKFTGKIYDANWNTLFRFEDVATVKNLTLDASEATEVQRGITFKTSVTVDNCTLIGNGTTATYAVIVGEGAGAENIGNVTANITNSTFKNWKNGVTDNMNGQDMKEFAVTGCTFENANVQISAYESITFTGNTTDSDVQITSYTADNTLNVTAIENNLAADGTYTVNAGGTLQLQDEFLTPVADVNGKIYFTLQEALDYAVTKGGDVTVKLLDDINLEGTTWTPVYFNSYPAENTNTLIIDGNYKTISNFSDMLFSNTWTGTKLEVKNLTISKASIKHNVDDTGDQEGVGAVVGYISATDEVVFDNVHLVESHVEGGHWTGGLIGYAAGYSKNDGPVFTDIVITNCEISGSTIVGKGSVGGVVGHAAGDAWTSFDVKTTSVTGNTITSTGSSNDKAGIVMGTIGTAGQETTTNGITHTGGVFVSVEETGNTAKSHETIITTIYGRQGSTGGVLTLTEGGSYQNNPIEENVAYAVVAPGFKLELNENDTYGVVVDLDYGMVARIGETRYETIAAALAATTDNAIVTIIKSTNETIGVPAGNNVTITALEGVELSGGVGGSYYNKSVIFDGLTFMGGKGMALTASVDGLTYTVKNCTFYGVQATAYKQGVISLNGNATVVVVNNTITNVQNATEGDDRINTYGQQSAGIYTNKAVAVTISENTISGVDGTGISSNSNVGEVNITDNTVSKWGTGATAKNEGRAIRTSGGTEVAITGNVMIDEGTAKEEFVKSETFTSLDASGNYWDGKSPLEDNMFATDVTSDPALILKNYYKDQDKDTMVVLPASVAKIEGKYYQSLQTAIDAATDGQTVTIVINVNLNNTLTVAADKTFTLDLNGKVVSGVSNTAASSAVITNNGNLTVKTSVEGGKITTQAIQPDTNWGGEGEPQYPTYANNTINNYGTFTLLSGLVENTTAGSACYALDNYAGSTANIEGGKLSAEKTTVRIFNWTNGEASKATLNVIGGEIYSKDGYAININSGNAPYVDLNISGGTITTDDTDYNLAVYVYSDNNGNGNGNGKAENFNVNITGGTFNGDVAVNGAATATMKQDAVKVSGGTFNGSYGVFSYADDAVAVPVISITGGTFKSNYSEIYSYDDGYKFIFDNTTQMYGLQAFSDLEISNLHELIAFRNAVNAGNTFAGQTVVLSADVDLNPSRAIENWIPIGTEENPFLGTFDGGDKTISNLTINDEDASNLGLFGRFNSPAVLKNIKIKNVSIKGKSNIGAVVGTGYTGTIDNCHVTGEISLEGNYKVGGISGQGYAKINNSSVIATEGSDNYVKATYSQSDLEGDNVGGIVGHTGEGQRDYKNNTVKNITISGTRKVGGIAGILHQTAQFENNVVENVTIETTAKSDYANSNLSTMSMGALIGQYYTAGSTNDGTVKECVVKNVTFSNVYDVTVDVGPIVGGARGGTDGMLAPSTDIVSEGNLIYMSTITGSNNLYLMNAVAQIGETKYYTLQEAVDAGNGKTINVIATTTEDITIAEGATITLTFAEDVTLNGYIAPFNGNLTINGGTINNTNADYSAIEITSGELALNNVNIASARHGVRIDGDVTAEVNGGNYTLNTSAGLTQHAFNISGAANVTINNGKFVGPAGTSSDSGAAINVKVNSTVVINGGDFSGGKLNTLSSAGTLIVKGGTYDQDPSAYLADGYVAQKNAEGKYEVFFAVAQIGTTYYKTIQDAVDAGREGETITILADVEATVKPTADSTNNPDNCLVYIANGKTITIDLNGNDIIVNGDDESQYDVLAIRNNGNLTITDSSETAGTIQLNFSGENESGSSQIHSTILNFGTLTVDKVNVVNNATTGYTSHTIFNYSWGGNAILTVNGGTISSVKGYSVYASAYDDFQKYSCEVNIIDGTLADGFYYDNTGYHVADGAKVMISGGVIEKNANGDAYTIAGSGITNVAISGGTFSEPVLEEHCANGYIPTENVDGTYGVKLGQYVAQVGDVKYETLENAVSALNETNNEVVILVNCSESVSVPAGVVFNLNGKNIEGTITASGDLTFKGDGYVTALKNTVGGVITVEDDKTLALNNFSFGINANASAEYTITGGKITADYGFFQHGIYNLYSDFETGYMYYSYGSDITVYGSFHSEGKGDGLDYVRGKLTVANGGESIHDKALWVGQPESWGAMNATLVVEEGGKVQANTLSVYNGSKLQFDAQNLNVGDEVTTVVCNTLTVEGDVETINNDAVMAVVEGNKIVIKAKPVMIVDNNTYYTSLQGAIDAAEAGQTVKVITDITLTETVTVAAGTTVTLDLNGKTVSQTKEQTTGYQMILNDGNLTIVDNTEEKLGKISYTDSGNGGEYVSNTITNRGTITVKSGTIENLSSETVAKNGYPYAIDSSIWGEASEVNTIVEGGKVHGATYSAIRLRADSSSEPVNVTVSGGEIVGTIEVQVPSSIVAGKGTLSIIGGKLSNSGTSNVLFFFGFGASAENIKVSVSGGEFTGNITISSVNPIGEDFNKNFITGGTFGMDVNEYCHEHYDAIQGDDNLWRVEQVLFAQTTELQAGWNWFSSYINLASDEELVEMQNAFDGKGIEIKGRTGFSDYQYIGDDENGVAQYKWYKTEDFSISAKQMYMIKTTEALDLVLDGKIVDPAANPISLKVGWNWIGYPMTENVAINVALENLEAEPGDVIKSRNGESEYIEGYGWDGDVLTMEPGVGYKYYSQKRTTFVYNSTTDNSRYVNENVTPNNNYWLPEVSQYADNMSIVAMLNIDGEIAIDNYEIAAFVNGECRGSARPVYIEALDVYMVFMMVYGEESEELSFKYYDVNYETEYELNDVITYYSDSRIGSVNNPYMFNLDILNIGETSVENISIYPNPTTTGSEINLQAVCDKVEVFNALGVKVAEYTNVDSIDAIETAGVYVIRLTIDNSARNCRLIVK